MTQRKPNRCIIGNKTVVRRGGKSEKEVDGEHWRALLLGLEVVEEDAALLGFLTPVLDNDARAVDDFAGVAFAVDLAY
jgi:ribosomal 30S subunit maturation factor RimM